MEQKKIPRWVEPLFVWLCIGAAIGIRFLLANRYQLPLSEKNDLVELAQVQVGKIIPYMTHGCEYVYVNLMQGFFSLVGNRPFAALYLQAILQVIGILVACAGIGSLFSKWAGYWFLMVFSLCPLLTAVNTAQFFAVLACVLFGILCFFFRSLKEKEHGLKRKLLEAFWMGVLVGGFVYCDLMAVVFIGFCLLGTLYFTQAEETVWMHKIAVFMMALFGSGMGIFFVLLAKWNWFGITFVNSVAEYVTYAQNLFKNHLGHYIEFGILFSGIFFSGIVAALIQRKQQKQVVPSVEVVAVVTEETTEVEEGPKIKFIENPLPVPKRHEKKEMDFAIEPTHEFMKFDIELTEGNAEFDV